MVEGASGVDGADDMILCAMCLSGGDKGGGRCMLEGKA